MGIFDFIKKRLSRQKEEESRNVKVSIRSKSTINNEIIEDEIIPVEERLKYMKPGDQGLYPHEILVLSYAPTFYTDGNNSFQGFWWYQYGIKDVNKVLDSLLDRKLIRVGSIESAMWKSTVVELKDILRENDHKVSGKKEVLIKRLLDEVDEEKLNGIFTRRTYETTDLGEEVLKRNEHIPYIHRKGAEDLDIFSLNELVKKQKPGYSYRDAIWGYLNKRGMEHISGNNFGLYRNCRFTMSEFVYEENKLDNAFALLVEVIRYDLSGLSNGFNLEYLYIYNDNFFPYEESIINMAPGITKRVVNYKKAKELSDEQLREEIIKYGEKISLPFSIFTVDECADIVLMEINEDKDGLVKLYSEAEKRFNKQYKF